MAALVEEFFPEDDTVVIAVGADDAISDDEEDGRDDVGSASSTDGGGEQGASMLFEVALAVRARRSAAPSRVVVTTYLWFRRSRVSPDVAAALVISRRACYRLTRVRASRGARWTVLECFSRQ